MTTSNRRHIVNIATLVINALSNTAIKIMMTLMSDQNLHKSAQPNETSHRNWLAFGALSAGSLTYSFISRYFGLVFNNELKQAAVDDSSVNTKHEGLGLPMAQHSSIAIPNEQAYTSITPQVKHTTNHGCQPSSVLLAISSPYALILGLSTVGSFMSILRQVIPGYHDYFSQEHEETHPLLAALIVVTLGIFFGVPAAYQNFLYRIANVPRDLPKLAAWFSRSPGPDTPESLVTFYGKRVLASLVVLSNCGSYGITNFFNGETMLASASCEYKFIMGHNMSRPILPNNNATTIDSIHACSLELKKQLYLSGVFTAVIGVPITLAGCWGAIKLLDGEKLSDQCQVFRQQSIQKILLFLSLCAFSQILGLISTLGASSTISFLNNAQGLVIATTLIQLILSIGFDSTQKWFPNTNKVRDRLLDKLKQLQTTPTNLSDEDLHLSPHMNHLRVSPEVLQIIRPASQPQPRSSMHRVTASVQSLLGFLLPNTEKPALPLLQQSENISAEKFVEGLTTAEILKLNSSANLSNQSNNYLIIPRATYFKLIKMKSRPHAENDTMLGSPTSQSTFFRCHRAQNKDIQFFMNNQQTDHGSFFKQHPYQSQLETSTTTCTKHSLWDILHHSQTTVKADGYGVRVFLPALDLSSDFTIITNTAA